MLYLIFFVLIKPKGALKANSVQIYSPGHPFGHFIDRKIFMAGRRNMVKLERNILQIGKGFIFTIKREFIRIKGLLWVCVF